ncbi:zinc finger CCCH domain-containing protein 6-like [Humulus lupulus]|uniref:zinc finger CCCH domain-containing protein 6-like n=1 Tax=Humulus lupulus TaxID=3486 RepID=UPI002B4130A6|nr:zinc finger CCCH domain-containing protein 6-like [Humulus lupulus]
MGKVKMFNTKDYPTKVDMKYREKTQRKSMWGMMNSNTTRSNNNNNNNDLPPGFEHGIPVTQTGMKTSYVFSQTQWKCPLKIMLSPSWRVVSGEESEEVKHQKLRETRVFKAIYPRLSSIPSNPSVFPEVKNGYYDDGRTPLVPLIPIEEESAKLLSENFIDLDLLIKILSSPKMINNLMKLNNFNNNVPTQWGIAEEIETISAKRIKLY